MTISRFVVQSNFPHTIVVEMHVRCGRTPKLQSILRHDLKGVKKPNKENYILSSARYVVPESEFYLDLDLDYNKTHPLSEEYKSLTLGRHVFKTLSEKATYYMSISQEGAVTLEFRKY